MMFASLLAEATTSRTTYDFERWQSFGERWHVLALVAVCAAVLLYVVSLYRRDSVELRPGLGLVLLALRVTALLGRVGILSGTGKTDRAGGHPQLARAGAGRHQLEHGPARHGDDQLGRGRRGRRRRHDCPIGWSRFGGARPRRIHRRLRETHDVVLAALRF